MKEQIKLKEKERLLTEQEREHIISAYQNRDWRLIIILCTIVVLLFFLISVFLFYPDNLSGAIIWFISMCILVGLYFGEAVICVNKVLEGAKKNEIYVKEAIFLDSNKYHQATFEIIKKGRREYFFCKAGLKDDINVEDKVILMKIKKKYVWAYKAME